MKSFNESTFNVAVQVCEKLESIKNIIPKLEETTPREYLSDERVNFVLCIGEFDRDFKNSEKLFTSSEVGSFIELALRMSRYSETGVINSCLNEYGYKLIDTTKELVPFNEGYENLRKKINRTKDKPLKEYYSKQLCQFYLDHEKVPKQSFKYIRMYNKMKAASRL